ncbi:MAG: hypothetical protein ACREBC_36945 [Pyrinomonadaceae bacterium]
MPESRTRDRALSELLRLLPGVREEIADASVRPILTESLVTEIFTLAWDHQFDEDRGALSRTFRQVVREALEGLIQET